MRTFLFVLMLICSGFCTQVYEHGVWVSGRQCYSGYAEFLNFSQKSVLVVENEMIVDNLNLNASGSVLITKTGKLTVKSSINLNGSNYIENYGTLIAGNMEIQGDGASFVNKGVATLNEIQLSHPNGSIDNCGEITVANFTNFHNGTYRGCNCSSLVTKGLNVNKANVVTGVGSIKVTETLNLNQTLTQSPIKLCYNGPLNQPEKLGGASRTCDLSCSSQPLPIVFGNIRVTRNENIYEIQIPVISSYDVKQVNVMFSEDYKTWRRVMVIMPETLQAGHTYTAMVEI